MRHYEILSAGSMPWYPDLETSPESAMNFLPKQLMLAARYVCAASRHNGVCLELYLKSRLVLLAMYRDMPGVSQGMIDHQVSN